MATTTVQWINVAGEDRSESGRYYLRRLSEASCTYWVTFQNGRADVHPTDLQVLLDLGVVRLVS